MYERFGIPISKEEYDAEVVAFKEGRNMKIFPVPITFTCPFCGHIATLERFDNQSGLAYYKHEVIRTIDIEELSVQISIIHEFVTSWENGWQHLDLSEHNKATKKGSWLKNIASCPKLRLL